MSDVLEGTRTDDKVVIDEGDHDRFSHYVPKDKLTESIYTGNPVLALCGKMWTPTRDGRKFPVCPDCKRLMDEIVGSNLPENERGGPAEQPYGPGES